MKKLNLIILLLTFSLSSLAQEHIDISGKWLLKIDRKDVGEKEKWFNNLSGDEITLPGSMTTNRKGDDITLSTPWTGQIVDSSWFKQDRYAKYRTADNLKIPAWLQPIKYYKGAAWYIKEILVTPEIASKPLEITLERPHWETSMWIDGVNYGTQNSLGTPHRYAIPSLTTGKHIIAIKVDNRIKSVDVGHNAHSVSDHTQSNWNGIVGELSIKTKELVSIKNVQIYPDIDRKEVKVVVTAENLSTSGQSANITLQATSRFAPKLHKLPSQSTKTDAIKGISNTEIIYPMDEFYLWDEFTPYLYTMNVKLGDDSKDYQFGMRKFEAQGKLLHMNGRPLFMRGTLECAIFPLTGFPATDKEEWSRIINICKAHGLNHIRFHSWCPPKAAFEAADRLGMYLQVEGGGWCSVGDGSEFDKWAYKEADLILDEYGNHPSFVLYTYGNEPGGDNQARYLGDLVNHLSKRDSRHLYTSAAGWPSIPENEFRNDMYPRLKVWGTDCLMNTEKPCYNYNFDELTGSFTIPWISHEIGQWCVYPDFKEINMYDDAVLQAKNFEIFRETLADNGMEDLGEKFLMASGKLQTLLYKTEIESAMRTKDFGGYQLLDLHDFPGQGTALVGVLNPFWESKGYVTAEEYHRFASATVPLIRSDKVIYTNSETLNIPVEISHYGKDKFTGVVPSWKLQRVDGEIYAYGNLPKQDIGYGNCIALGTISQPLTSTDKAEKLTLTVDVCGNSNSWDFWVYPTTTTNISTNIKVVNTLNSETLKYLQEGGKVLFTPQKDALKAEYGGDIKSGFTTIFWNSAWTARNQPPLTLGLLIDNESPMFNDFPTEYYTNFQWYNAITDVNIVNLTNLGCDIEPQVRVIDDWFENRSLGLIFETKIGQGKLLYCGADLIALSKTDPEMNALLQSLANYMDTDKFNPTKEVDITKILK